jgi:hypothetical protein
MNEGAENGSRLIDEFKDHKVTVFERYDYDQNSYDANDDEIQAASVDHNKIVRLQKKRNYAFEVGR